MVPNKSSKKNKDLLEYRTEKIAKKINKENRENGTVSLIFKIDKQRFALFFSEIQKVIEDVEITKIFNTNRTLLGLVNQQGEILPVFSLASILNLPDSRINNIVILNRNSGFLAISIDELEGSKDIFTEEIQHIKSKHSDLYLGVYHNETIVIDAKKIIEKILSLKISIKGN